MLPSLDLAIGFNRLSSDFSFSLPFFTIGLHNLYQRENIFFCLRTYDKNSNNFVFCQLPSRRPSPVGNIERGQFEESEGNFWLSFSRIEHNCWRLITWCGFAIHIARWEILVRSLIHLVELPPDSVVDKLPKFSIIFFKRKAGSKHKERTSTWVLSGQISLFGTIP
jgi:hypothetical protein